MSLTITIGCPGSGKSTWADKNLPAGTLRLERDRFRECLWGSRRAYHDSPIDHSHRSDVITTTMLAAMKSWPTTDWAVTDTGLRYEAVEPFIKHALYEQQDIKLVLFERAPAYLLSCNRIRPHAHRIPEEILLESIEAFNDLHAWWWLSEYPIVRAQY